MLMAAFRLAFLFRRPLSELNMTLTEFMHWIAFLDMEPPDRGDNERTAALMAQITNMSGRSLKDKKTVTAADFLGGQTNKQSMSDQIAFMRGLGNKDG